MWYIRDGCLRFVRGASGSLRPGRVALVAIVVAAFALPWGLYLHEHARRAEIQRAYSNSSSHAAAEIATLRYSMGNLLDEQAMLRDLLLESGYAVVSENELAIPAVATGYSSSVIETDNTPFITASNTRTRSGIVALSRDLLRRYTPGAPFQFGDVVHISGLGDFVVEDSMNQRWRNRVDVWFPSRRAAFNFGRRDVILRTRISNDAHPGDAQTAYRYTLPSNLVGGSASESAVNAP